MNTNFALHDFFQEPIAALTKELVYEIWGYSMTMWTKGDEYVVYNV